MQHPLYTINAQGLFSINLHPLGRCGAAGNAFRYQCEITVDALDEKKFVFDGDMVPKAFDRFRHGMWKASCEDIAGGLVWVFRSLCGARATSIKIRVWPSEVRSLTVEWHRGWKMPTTYPKQVDLAGRVIDKKLGVAKATIG